MDISSRCCVQKIVGYYGSMNAMAAGSGRNVWPALLSLVLLSAGCATQKIDWAGRVGNYSYDQAVMELGPPDKSAKLSDGIIVAEWLTRRGSPAYNAIGYGYYPYPCWGPAWPGYVNTYWPDYYLRLTFGPDGKLEAWKKFSK